MASARAYNGLMLNAKLLMSDAKNFNNLEQINPYYHSEDVDTAGAEREHARIRRMLEDCDIKVVQVPAPRDSQDGVYTANWALVRGERAVLARLPDARKSEEAWARHQLQKLGYEVIDVPEDWHFSGQGDALACGNYLFCGQGYRSDLRAQQFAADALDYERIQLQTLPELDDGGKPMTNAVSGWPDSFYYDIDLALAVIREPEDGQKGLIAYCPEAFTTESQAILERIDFVDAIIVSEAEARTAFACNLVSTGETVVMSKYAPQLKAALEAHGLKTISPEVSELVKGGGFIRCTSLRLA